MNLVVFGLDIVTAVSAFVAAWFWFQSARHSAPPDTWEGGAKLPGFLDSMSKFNRWGATFAGLSAVCAGVRIALNTFLGSPSI